MSWHGCTESTLAAHPYVLSLPNRSERRKGLERKLAEGGVLGEEAPIIECEEAIEMCGGGSLGLGSACPAGEGGGLEDVSHVIYTSGTTGKPKGVVCEHR